MRSNFYVKTIVLVLSVLSVAVVNGQDKSSRKQGGGDRVLPAIGQITGVVIDSVTGNPIEYSTVALYRKKNNELITGTVSDKHGKFFIEKLAPGMYNVKVSFMGYVDKTISGIRVSPKDPIVSVKKIRLSTTSEKLDEVVIDGSAPRVDFQIDKKVINVSKQLTTLSGSAVDVLENIPSVNVDIEGNVSLRGSSGFTVLIDGRPSVLDANDALQQIPATTIDNVEIITNPSAKFDPDGTAGIINIITKKNKLQGFSGVVNLNVGLDEKYGGDILLNYKKRKVNVYFGVDYNLRNHPGDVYSERRTYSGDTTFFTVMSGSNDRKRETWGLKAGMDYSFSANDVIGISARYGDRGMTGNSVSQYDEWIEPGEEHNLYTSIENSDRGGTFYAVNADYQHKFAKKGHEVKVEFSYDKRNFDENSINELVDSTGVVVDGKRNVESGPGKRFRAKIDYTYPINNTSKIEAGGQFRYGNPIDDTELWTLDTTTDEYVLQPEYTNTTDYVRNIQAFYGIYAGEWGNFGYQGGLRAEYTYRDVKSETVDQSYSIDRWDLFPSLHVSYQLPKDHQLMASYTRRIQRSRGWYLEPFITWVDAFNVRQGNPELLPEYIDSYEFGYLKNFNKKNMFSAEAYYRVTNNKVEHIKSVYEENIIMTSPQNVGSDYSLGVEFLLSIGVTKWWDVDLMGNYYNYIVEGELEGDDFSNEKNTWSSRFNNTFILKKKTKIQINSQYNGPSVTAQGETEGFYMVNAAVRHEFFDRKLSAVLQVRDIFATAKRESTSSGQYFWNYSEYTRKAPYVMLSLSYKFNNYRPDRKQKQSQSDDMEEL